ncbi:AAA family ATPase [Lysinibacillus sp. NPDC096418]|uniref:AAA family ATPase n=1 Tax=Lysinibacillus sp. NPDC096418 TaxID=3364138 RepID=UPI003824A451
MVRPSIIIVIGEAGVGKSAVGKLIAKEKKYTYIDKDTATISLTEQYLEECSPTKNKHDRESDFYLSTVRPLEYKTILALALENLELGNSVVLTAGFELEIQDENWLQMNPDIMKIRAIADLKVVMVTVDKQTLLNRLITRNELRDTWKLNNWDAYLKQVAAMKITWNDRDYTNLSFDNSDALPILYDIKVNNLIKTL